MSKETQRYTAIAIVLHWAIAAAILFMLPLGFWMHEQAEHGNASQAVFSAYQLHKSVGLTILALSLTRLGWRLVNPPPPLPVHMPSWERLVARVTHWAFYALIIALPLSGWLFVSAGWSIHDDAPLAVPTRFFNLFEVPHLFDLSELATGPREDAAEAAATAHKVLAFAMIGLAVLHGAAALKHHILDRDGVLASMVPGLRAPGDNTPAPRDPVRLAILGGGLAATALALTLLLISVTQQSASSAPSSIEIVEPEAPAVTEGSNLPSSSAAEIAPPTPDQAPAWIIDQRSSAIIFSYTYEDDSGATRFNGRFARWSADIRFDTENLDASIVAVRIEIASAATGVPAHDGALPGPEWFDAAAHPVATFRTTRIRASEDGYEARGQLTIKGVTREVDLPFRLTIEDGHAAMTGSVVIDRRDFGVGEGSGDDLISRNIRIDIRVDADRVR